MKTIITFLALLSQAYCSPLSDWDISFDEPTANVTQSLTAQELGITDDFLHKLQSNWEKAVQAEKEKEDRQRQGIGEYFGLGGGLSGGSGGGGSGDSGGSDAEEEDEGPTTMGPGAAGILTGVFGILSGLGSLNPKRVIQSTVNFFPPNQRVAAQMALDAAFGIKNNGTETSVPVTNVSQGSGMMKPSPIISGVTTAPVEKPAPVVVVPKENPNANKLMYKGNTLVQDFQEAAGKLSPVIIQESKKI